MAALRKFADTFHQSSPKFCPPGLSRILPRSRLEKIFEENNDKKLFLIIGQPAQGKTTTAATWFHKRNSHSSIWVNLDPEDSDPVNLFNGLIEAFCQKQEEKDLQNLLTLTSQTFESGRNLYLQWASALYKTLKEPYQIFLDGLDRLSPEAESYHFIQFLIEKMPQGFKFILTSRTYPPKVLEFQNLKMKRQALLLTNVDLAFTPEEIMRFTLKCQGLTLDWEQVDRIFKISEGWIGGILMLVDSLRRSGFPPIEQNIYWESTESYQRDSFQYFNQEAFKSLTALQQKFLLRSSILKNLEPEIVREIIPGEEGEVILKELAGRNLFIQAFPITDKGVIFRYHQLFRDFLTTMVHSEISEVEWRQWHRQAGSCYQEKGIFEEAVYHYLEAQAFPEAIFLIKELGLDLIRKGRFEDLENWLRKLPKQFIFNDPWLLFFDILKKRFNQPEENIRNLKTAVDLFKQRGDISGILLSMAFLIETEFTLGIFRPELIQEAEELLRELNEENFLYERAHLWVQIGLVHSIRGSPRQGYWACQNAYLLGNRLGDPLFQVIVLCHSISCLSILGEFRQAERLMKEIISFSFHIPTAEIRFHQAISKIIYLLFRGEVREAVELSKVIHEDMEKQGLINVYPLTVLHKQITLVYAQEHQQAEEISNQLFNLAAALDSNFLKAVTGYLSGISAYWTNRRIEANQFIEQSLDFFQTGDSRSELYFFASRFARALLTVGVEKRLAAIKEIQEVLGYSETNKSYLLQTECYLGLGLLYHDEDQKEEARTHFQKGFRLARQRNYYHFMVISPQDTVKACLLAQAYLGGRSAEGEYATNLVLKKFGSLALEELKELSGHPDPRVSKKAWEIRLFLHRAQAPKLNIVTFGGLHLSFDGQAMDEQDWDRFQPRQLLTTLLSKKNGRIEKDILIEILWPDADPETGGKNFKTTLQRLRKSLEPDLDPEFGSTYIHLQQNTVYLDPELCRIDVWNFVELCGDGCQMETNGDRKGALDCFTRAIDLYRGDFIPEDYYSPLVIGLRESLKDKYLDLLIRLSHIHEQSGAFKKAAACFKQAIEAEPLREENYRNLMKLYDKQKLYTEAILVFESCKKALKAGLDTPPDPLTVALYKGIKERAQKT